MQFRYSFCVPSNKKLRLKKYPFLWEYGLNLKAAHNGPIYLHFRQTSNISRALSANKVQYRKLKFDGKLNIILRKFTQSIISETRVR